MAGIDKNIKDKKGKIAADYTLRLKNKKLAHELLH